MFEHIGKPRREDNPGGRSGRKERTLRVKLELPLKQIDGVSLVATVDDVRVDDVYRAAIKKYVDETLQDPSFRRRAEERQGNIFHALLRQSR